VLVVLTVLVVLAVCVSPAAARPRGGSSGALKLVAASGIGPSRAGASGAPYGYKALHPGAYARAKALADARAHVQAAKPSRGGGAGPTVSSYANISPSFNAAYDAGVTPPDTTGAIGPDRYIETINTEYAIYNRSGSLINSGTLSALTGISGGLFGYSLSDPQMMWDALTQRFYYSAVYYDAFMSDNGLAVGWSKTATPASSADFCQYAISFGSELPDYPKLGDSSDFLLYGYNKFSSAGSTYDGSEFAALNKPPAGSGCAPTSDFTVTTSGTLLNADGSRAATPVPANLVDDSNRTGYVVANADLSTVPSANFVSVFSVSTAGTSNGIPVPAIAGPANVVVPSSYQMPPSAPERGSSYLLDTLDGRFEAAVAAIDPTRGSGGIAVWTAHAVAGGAGSEERWYEIDPVARTVLQSGSVSSSSLYIWNGAISPDRANNGSSGSFGGSMAISVSTSSASAYPAIQLLFKHGVTASALTNLVQSNGPAVDFSCSSTTPCRWGDYSGASPDPAATGTTGRIWLGNQYNTSSGSTSSTNWRTWLFAVTPTG
jgi:hypothetical protein